MKYFLSGLIVSLLIVVIVMTNMPFQTSASIGDAYSYNSVVTGSGTGVSTNKNLLKLGYGTLGSVVITGAGAGTFEIYDATTTDSTIRTITATSSLRRLASFPTNAAVGTYTFDTYFSQGLIIAFTGTQGTTTVTYR